MSTHSPTNETHDANADPLTGEAGAHPVATGIGAAAVGAAGLAVAAAVAGPVGVAVATAGGAIIGGYVGKAVGEVVDPTAEEAFWRDAHPHQEFATDHGFDDLAPAYRTGYEGYHRFGGDKRSFEEAEADLRAHYEGTAQNVPWVKARVASQAAWNRVHRGEAKKIQAPAHTGVTEAVLEENDDSGRLGNARMPR